MIISFNNKSKYSVSVTVNNKKVLIKPYKNEKINVEKTKNVIFEISTVNKSKIKFDIFDSILLNFFSLDTIFIVLKTTFLLTELNEFDTFKIYEETVRFESNGEYQRLFLNSENKNCIKETCEILDKDRLIKNIKRLNTARYFYEPVLEDFVGLPLILIIVGIVLGIAVNLKAALIYALFAYIFLFLINILIKKTSSFFIKKINKKMNVSLFEDMSKYTDVKYINDYYSNPNRKSFFDK